MSYDSITPDFSPDELNYQDSFLYRQAMVLAEECLRLVQQLPVEERFNMVDQILQASVAVPANIAGADQSDTRKRKLRYLDVARGKLKRLEALLVVAREVGFLQKNALGRAKLLANEIDGLLLTQIKQLRSRRWD